MQQIDRYSCEDIFQIINDFYDFQANYSLDLNKEKRLTLSTTIKEWRFICDLVIPHKLALSYHQLFNLETNKQDLIDIFTDEKISTIKKLCNYIALNAYREPINPIISLGVLCKEATIFKIIKKELVKRKLEVLNFKPSAKFLPFFSKYSVELLEIISKIAPGTIKYNIETPKFTIINLFLKRNNNIIIEYDTIRDLIMDMKKKL